MAKRVRIGHKLRMFYSENFDGENNFHGDTLNNEYSCKTYCSLSSESIVALNVEVAVLYHDLLAKINRS